MTRVAFDLELERLQQEVLTLGLKVKKALLDSVDSLKTQDLDAAGAIVAADEAINKARFVIENDILVLIARHQPMATDLRLLAAFLEIATELERIGDYAKGIAKITLKMSGKPLVKPLVDIPRMAENAGSMLDRALDSLVRRDADLARAVAADDDEMDALYDQVFRELMTYIIADPRTIEGVSYLTWAAHNLERAADRVLNICERVIFTVTGEMIEFDAKEFGQGE